MKITHKMAEEGAKAVHAFLEERFPDGALPGGVQLFAKNNLDPTFAHEAGCKALALRAIRAALKATKQ